MKASEFNTLVDRRKTLITKILQKKANEYSKWDDRLYNFKRSAMISNCQPETALLGMNNKHLVSVIDIVEAIEKNPDVVFQEEYINEKVGDLINYCILLEALLHERYEKTWTNT